MATTMATPGHGQPSAATDSSRADAGSDSPADSGGITAGAAKGTELVAARVGV
jgi:hypothetical protein